MTICLCHLHVAPPPLLRLKHIAAVVVGIPRGWKRICASNVFANWTTAGVFCMGRSDEYTSTICHWSVSFVGKTVISLHLREYSRLIYGTDFYYANVILVSVSHPGICWTKITYVPKWAKTFLIINLDEVEPKGDGERNYYLLKDN